jgi:hypothetical protein
MTIELALLDLTGRLQRSHRQIEMPMDSLCDFDPRGEQAQSTTAERVAADAAAVAAYLTALYGPDSDLHQALGLIPTKGATP